MDAAAQTAVKERAAIDHKIEVLNKSLVRIAVLKDDKLEATLENALPKFLLLLNTDSSAVREKVLQILSHINCRLDIQQNVKLPVEKLFRIYHSRESKNCVPLATFCLIYIERAFKEPNRISSEKVNKLLPLILVSLSKRNASQRLTRLHILLQVLPRLQLSLEFNIQKAIHQNQVRFNCLTETDRQLLLEFLFNVMLLLPIVKRRDEPEHHTALGLSPEQLSNVTRNDKLRLSQHDLVELKIAIVKFVGCGIFSQIQIIPILLAGCSAPNGPLQGGCESELRNIRKHVDIDLDSCEFKCCYSTEGDCGETTTTWIDFFFSLYGIYPKETVRTKRRSPVSLKFQLLLMPYFEKSRKMINHRLIPSLIQRSLRFTFSRNGNGQHFSTKELRQFHLEVEFFGLRLLHQILNDKFSLCDSFVQEVSHYFNHISNALQNNLIDCSSPTAAKKRRTQYSAVDHLHDKVRISLYSAALKLMTRKPTVLEEHSNARTIFETLNREPITVQRGVTEAISDLQGILEEARPSLPNTLRNIMFSMYYSTPSRSQSSLGPLAQKFLQYLDHLVSRQQHRLAFMKGFHNRLGENSPIRRSLAENKLMDVNALRMIWAYLERWKTADFQYE